MPPKQKGQNTRGRDKVFRHAVEHVHIGVGHAVLGNLTLQLAAGPPPSAAAAAAADRGNSSLPDQGTSSEVPYRTMLQQQQAQAAALLADRPAFYLELNAQLLSHTSKDFKKFRWEVLELCETRPLFLHHRYEIARKLLDCLMDRSSGSFTSKSKAAAATQRGSDVSRGETSEAFEAFARLTTAFVRDLHADFLPFYEVFQEALQAGLFDKRGNLLADTNRLQLVYAVQAAWCRELMHVWLPAATSSSAADDSTRQTRQLVVRIVGIYVRQLHDTKEYIRRLGAEWLAYLCRLCRPMVPLVCELASADILAGFEAEGLAEVRAAIAQIPAAEGESTADNERDELDNGGDQSGHDGDDDNADGSGHDEEESSSSSSSGADSAQGDAAAALAQHVWSHRRVQQFVAHELGSHPVVDGLCFFAAELFRGMRGSLNASFERYYAELLESFLLLDAADKARTTTTTDTAAELFGDGEAAEGNEEDESRSGRTGGSASLQTGWERVHSARWAGVFASAAEKNVGRNNSSNGDALLDDDVEAEEDARDAAEEAEEENEEGVTCVTAEAVRAARVVVREVGATAMQAALGTLLSETRRHSSSSAVHDEDSDSNDDEDEDEENADDDGGVVGKKKRLAEKLARRKRRLMLGKEGRGDAAGEPDSDAMRPSHRLLNAVVVCLQARCPQHLRILATLMNASHYFLWNDPREIALLQAIAAKLRSSVVTGAAVAARGVKGGEKATEAIAAADGGEMEFLGGAGALLELLYPLYATPYFDLTPGGNALHNYSNSAALHDPKTRAWLMELQKIFLPAAKECVGAVARIAYTPLLPSGTAAAAAASTAARKLLFAFAQDVLQKNFTFCLAEERRRGESGGAGRSGDGDGDDEASDDGGEDGRATASARTSRRRRAQAHDDEDREEAYVEEEAGALAPRYGNGGGSHSSPHTHAGASTSGAVAAVPSTLTPLALTLLHAVCLAAWTAANAELHDHHRHTRASVSLVDDAVLLARLTLDQTRHMRSCPLQQLLRLVSQRTKEQKKGKTSSSSSSAPPQSPLQQQQQSSARAGEEMTKVLEELLHRLVSLAEDATATPPATTDKRGKSLSPVSRRRAFHERALDWLSASLPLLNVLNTSPMGDIKKGLLTVLRNIKAATEASASTTHYSLYATISVLLVTLAAGPKARRAKLGRAKHVPLKPEEEDAAAAPVEPWQAEESLQHVSETISVLARGFLEQQRQQEQRRRATAAAAAAAGTEDVEAEEELEETLVGGEHALGEEGRARLLHGAELLLNALLTAIAVEGSSLRETGERGHHDGKPTKFQGAEASAGTATAAALAALAKLRTALTPQTQQQLVEVILFESLAAPSQPLRVLALRLLRLLCHPRVSAEARFAGIGKAIDTAFFDALLVAEQFNPLSQSGNLDGVRQALVKLTFAAEAGTITDPLERSILARAMIGLLYMKFADAWPIALKILSDLVRHERTTMLPPSATATAAAAAERDDEQGSGDDEDDGGIDKASSTRERRREKTADPVVWDTVVCRYAHLLVFGDVLGTARAAVARNSSSGTIEEGEGDGDAEGSGSADEDSGHCLYHIRLTDFQRYQKGELISNAFSVAQYIGSAGTASHTGGGGSSFALVDATEGDDEAITWRSHAHYLLAGSSAASVQSGGRKTRNRAATAPSTDRSTLAKTFLGALEGMMKGSSPVDRKLRLVEDIVLELVALQRDEHPASSPSAGGGGGGGGGGKRLDERLVLAMRACTAAPTTALSPHELRRLPPPLAADIGRRNDRLTQVYLSYTSDTNGKLQRAALDNLKRLKVEPFTTYYTQLTPYCADMKSLFGFLTSFHVETDVLAGDQADYISCAISVALPKLIAHVPKEKRRDQAVLRRRLMSFITHLSDRMMKEESSGSDACDALALVLDGLVQRLLFGRVTNMTPGEEEGRGREVAAASSSSVASGPRATRLAPSDFDFPRMWEGWVRHALDRAGGGSHCTRRLERLCRQLLSTVQLLESLLHAVGTRFASYVTSCLHLLLQSYLVGCKQVLKKPIEEAVAQRPGDSSVAGFDRNMTRALSASTLSSVLAQLRRASLTVVAQLFEQFPEDAMVSMETSPSLLYVTSASPSRSGGSKGDDLSATIFGRYISALYANSRGVTHDASTKAGGGGSGSSGGGGGAPALSRAFAGARAGAGQAEKSHVTPILRLMTAWSQSTALLPLFALFPDVVVGTFAEVFAVNGAEGRAGASGPAHRASSLALRQGLSCLNDLLSLRDEAIPSCYFTLSAGASAKGSPTTPRDASRTAKRTSPTTTTFGQAFLALHVVPIFFALYRLVVRGADADGASVMMRSAMGDGVNDQEEEGGDDDNTSGKDAAALRRRRQHHHGSGSGSGTGGKRSKESKRIDTSTAAGKRAVRSILSFRVGMWKDIMQTISLLSRYITESGEVKRAITRRRREAAPLGGGGDVAAADGDAVDEERVGEMVGRLAEVALHVVTHPACIADNSTALAALDVVDRLLREVPPAQFSSQRHFRPLVHLTNVVTLPESRLKLCDTLQYVLARKAVVEDPVNRYGVDDVLSATPECRAAFQAQLAAVGRAVACLNSFDENNENLARYDYELRYHTFHSLIHFFTNRGNYGALAPAGARRGQQPQARPDNADDDDDRAEDAEEEDGGIQQQQQQQRAIRKEREYAGELDVRIPLDHSLAPLLCVEGFLAIAANAIFLLRDPESTIRALATQLLSAMLRCATTTTTTRQGSRSNKSSRYAQLVLEEVVRRELLPSLRRGVVARNVDIRTDHMVVFGAIGRYYPEAFPTFAKLYSPNTEQNFFQNVGHVQPKCRLHALAILRREAAELHVRDLLRVFIPFLLTAVKDFAQGKRDLRNLTEAKARGYCDAVLMTIAAITQKLPWEAYHRVLTLFLANASANAALRMPMLRGVVQVLNHFTFLDAGEENGAEKGREGVANGAAAAARSGEEHVAKEEEEDPDTNINNISSSSSSSSDDDNDDAEAALVAAEVRERRRQFRHKKIMHVLENDVLPQLFEFISDGDKKGGKKALGMMGAGGEMKGNQHSITAIRRAQQKEDKAAANTKNAILQLPVAIAITKIVKKFPEERFNFYVDHILDEVILKLRTKHDKHRDSARRILGALLRETGPGKLRFVVTKLKDNLVHGYQLHVLGYTVVTLLYQLYEPHSSLLTQDGGGPHGGNSSSSSGGGGKKKGKKGTGDDGEDDEADPVLGVIQNAAKRRRLEKEKQKRKGKGRNHQDGNDGNEDGDESDRDGGDDTAAAGRRKGKSSAAAVDPNDARAAAEREADDEVEAAEEELLAQLMPYYDSKHKKKLNEFDHAYGVACLMDNMDDLMHIFLDDYLGEVGMQKEQVELMSTMVEVKRNRSLQGFTFIARHCEAGRVMEVFLQKITWVLTPPQDAATADAAQLHGSERARVLLMQEMKNKYLTVNKNSAGADLVFVEKVRLLATRIARGLMSNPSMHVDAAFGQVRDLLNKHNAVREAKIKAFEARDGTRRIRGNAHLVLHAARHDTWKEQLDKNFLVEPVPERVDADFSTHTVLATQQKQKLRAYKGRYGKAVQEAARDFYREDPTTAVVLDTLDEFLMKFLLSVLKRVLGIGKEAKYTAAAVQLDLLRRRRQRGPKQEQGERQMADTGDGGSSGDEGEENDDEESEEDEEEKDDDPLEPHDMDEDDLDAFADAQQGDGAVPNSRGNADDTEDDDDNLGGGEVKEGEGEGDDEVAATTALEKDDEDDSFEPSQLLKRKNKKAKLSIRFTTEYRELLETLVPSVLATLQGEGSDPVIANALDCLLALVSLRPPLRAVHALNASLFRTVTSFFGRGGSIKQRAMRVCAAVIAHQPFQLATDQAAQLVRLVRAEITDRSPFLPMSLSLFYAVIGKHSHIVEVYDLIDLVAELMVHLSSKPVIVRKCVMILVRFLTEFKLTADKFRSHIDLLCKNLDYPEMTGRLALLECLDTLISRLPVVVLRQEAPVLLVPLAATITSCEWKRCRERAGRVLQNMARFAGIDVLVPILSTWLLGEQATRPQRTMAAQVWATILPALAKAYHLPDTATRKAQLPQHDASEEERDAYQASCEWALGGILDGCLYDQFKGAGVKTPRGGGVPVAGAIHNMSGVSRKDRAAAEMKGWTLVFYSLRCAEAMLVALPDTFYPVLGPRLLPALADRLITHSHPWVQAVAMRLLRHYAYTYVEQHCLYLQDPIAPSLLQSETDSTDGQQQPESDKPRLPYLLPPLQHTPPSSATTTALSRAKYITHVWSPQALHTLEDLAALLKVLLSRVGLSDVGNEQQYAARVLENDATRTESLKVMVYVAKALAHVAASLLVATADSPSFQKQIKSHIERTYTALFRHTHALVKPVLEQRDVTNYMVRTVTLVQFLGGFVSVLPQQQTSHNDGDDGDAEGGEEEENPNDARVNVASGWLLTHGMHILRFLHRTVRPLLAIAFAAGRRPQQRTLMNYTHQASDVITQQLEERRSLFQQPESGADAGEAHSNGAATGGTPHGEQGTDGRKPAKRSREEAGSEGHTLPAKKRKLTATAATSAHTATVAANSSSADADPALDTVLTALAASLAMAHEEKKEQKIAQDTKRNLKRNRHEMEKEERHHHRGGGGQKGVAPPSARASHRGGTSFKAMERTTRTVPKKKSSGDKHERRK